MDMFWILLHLIGLGNTDLLTKSLIDSLFFLNRKNNVFDMHRLLRFLGMFGFIYFFRIFVLVKIRKLD